MADIELGTVVRHIRKLAAFRSTKEMTDRQLLEAFLANRDDTAFAALVKRHGPLVLALSRRVLHQLQDAEDAFQATFLVLAQSAASIRKTEALGSWLHGVAYRIALRARRDITRRRVHERGVKVVPHPSPASDLAWPEVQVILDEEIQGLPEKYRAVFVFCCLEGKNGTEVAKELGLKEGTVRSRLSQARRKLQHRLSRRGITLCAVLGAAAIAEGKAAVPAVLADATVRAALLFVADKTAAAGLVSAQVAALVKEAGKAMFLTKLKTGVVLVLATGLVVAAGAGVLAQLGTAIQPTLQVQTDSSKPKDLERRGQRQTLNDPDAGPIPAEAIARIGSTRFRQWGEVTGLAYSPDGQWLASISTSPADSTARVWDAATGKEKLRVQIKMGEAGRFASLPGVIPRAVGFSADSKQFLVADPVSIRGFDIATGNERFAHEIASTGLIGAGLTPDGKTLVLARRELRQPGGDALGRIEVRDVATGKVRSTGEHPFGNWNTLPIEFAPDGKRFAVVATFAMGSEQPLPIYDTASGRQTGQIRVEGKSIAQVRFLPNQEMLALLLSGGQLGYERAMGFYDLKTAKLVRATKVDGTTYCFAVSPNGKLIFAGNGQKEFSQLIDVASGKEIGRLPSSFSLSTLAFSPDGNLLAAARAYSGAISVYEIPARRYHRWTAEPVTFSGTRFSSDGRTLLSQWGQHPLIDWRAGTVVRRPIPPNPESSQFPVSCRPGARPV